MDAVPEEQKQDVCPIDNTNLGQLANTEAPLFEAELMKLDDASF